ncbi:MAG: exodeoxyribonuclease III, partial [Pirellulales bacterium]|nr:exodeoxyribonuclease III [Pirellulales bacterium]
AILKKGFLEFVRSADPDVLCLQETKAHPEQVEMELSEFPHHFWNAAEKKGYSGTAVFSKVEPLDVRYGMDVKRHDSEGRLITLELADYFLVNCYTPNAQRELGRLHYRTRQWDTAFLRYVRKLDEEKPVVFCGDLNVAHREIDLARPKQNVGNAGFTDEERRSFDRIIAAGFIDTFRELHSEGDHYTWWSYQHNARARNIGWRIDYFLISPGLRSRLRESTILPDVMGSDHAPVMMLLD